MPYHEAGLSRESTPLLSNTQLNDWKHNGHNLNGYSQDVESTLENLSSCVDFQTSNTFPSVDGILQNSAEVRLQQYGGIFIYPKRWYILAVFSSLGMCQALIWNCFGPISNSLLPVLCPYWDETTIALLGNWANIMNILSLLPILWFFKTKGLRKSVILIAGMMVLGTILRCIPTDNINIFTRTSHFCAILNGIAGVVVFSAPPAVSAAWFPPGERTIATGVAIVSNNLGSAFSFLAGPAIVPKPMGHRIYNYTHISVKNISNGTVIDDCSSCPSVNDDEKLLVHKRLDMLMYLEAGIVSFVFMLILCNFPSKPKRPPSLTSTIERTAFVPSLVNICTNPQALKMMFCYSFYNGIISAWFCVMNLTFQDLPLGDTEDIDKIIGHIGFLAIVGNSVSIILVSAFVDKLKGRMKRTLIFIMVCGIICWIWLGLICLEIIPFSMTSLYLSTILASSLTYASSPIFFELTVELVYPVPEEVVGGFLTVGYSTIGMLFLMLFYIPALQTSPHWIPIALMVSTSIALPMLLLVKEEYRRLRLDINFIPCQQINHHHQQKQKMMSLNISTSCSTEKLSAI